MENVKQQIVSPEKFDYAMLHEDVRRWCKYHQTAMQNLSTDVFFRSGSYVSNGLTKKCLSLNVIMKLCDIIGEDLKKYEIVPKPAPVIVPEPIQEAPAVPAPPSNGLTGQGWECAIKVDYEFRTVAMKLFKNGEELAIGRSYLYDNDDMGVAKSVSYASHMCYKLIQQKAMAERGYKNIAENAEAQMVMDELEEADEPEAPAQQTMSPGSDRTIFKVWVRKYQNDNSAYGKCARFIDSHFPHFPSTSEKRMKAYLRLNGGDKHIQAFETLFAMYMNQDRQRFVENSRIPPK